MTSTHKSIKELDRIATLLDNQFKIGPFKFGLDPIIGLIPGIGDVIPLLFSAYLIKVAHKKKLKVEVIYMMVGNMAIDFVIGTIPLAGDIGDFFFKSSARNFKLLRKELEKKGMMTDEVIIEEGEVL